MLAELRRRRGQLPLLALLMLGAQSPAPSSSHATTWRHPAGEVSLRWSSSCDGLTGGFVEQASDQLASWRLPHRPEAASCEVTLTTEPEVAWVAGPATLIDAHGRHFQVEGQRHAGAMRWSLSQALLDEARFPALLDPRISPEVIASISKVVPWGAGGSFATDGVGWLAAVSSSNGEATLLLQFGPDGLPAERGQVPLDTANQLIFTDRYLMVSLDSFRSGRSIAEFMDGGSRPTPFTLYSGVRAPRASGGLASAQNQAPDGGNQLVLRELGPQLEWDGGEVIYPGVYLSQAVAEGPNDVLLLFENASRRARLMVTTPSGAPVGELEVNDGGTVGMIVSDGRQRTMVVLIEIDGPGLLRPAARFSEGGVWTSGRMPLDRTMAYPTVGAFDGVAFRLFTSQPDAGLLEQVIQLDGSVSPLRSVTPQHRNARPGGALPAATGLLVPWTLGAFDDLALRTSLIAPGSVPVFDAGPPLFLQPSAAFSPGVARRGDELFVVWNDTRTGAGVVELWGRRFAADLTPLDPDSFSTDPLHLHGNPGWATYGPGIVVATDAGYAVMHNTSFQFFVSLLGADGRPLRAPVDLARTSGLVISPQLAFSSGSLLGVYSSGLDEHVTLVDLQGGSRRELNLPRKPWPAVRALGTEGPFLLFYPGEVTVIDPQGTLLPSPFAPLAPDQRYFSAATLGTEVLALVGNTDGGPLFARFALADGGVGRNEPVFGGTGFIRSGELVSQGLTAWALQHEWLADGGGAVSLSRRDPDGGWSAPASFPVDRDELSALTPAPGGGVVIASGGPFLTGPSIPVRLRRIDWLENGRTCGAGVDCLSGFCVDDVCCESACGNGAQDCLVCGAGGACQVSSAGSTCRSAAGPCDLEETCDGTATECPADGFRDPGLVCAPAHDACQLDGVCTGLGAACPGVTNVSECDGGSAAGDAGSDAGEVTTRVLAVGCACGNADATALCVLALAMLRRRHSTRRR